MPEIDLRKNILVSGSFRIVVITLSFFVSWIIARYLGVELKGEYSYVITLGGFIWIVLDLGLYHSFPYLLRKNPAKTISVFSWTLYTFVAENLVLIALGLAFLPFWNRVMGYQFQPFYFVLFVLYLTLTKAFMQLQGLHIGRDKILHNSISTLLNTGFCLLLLLAAFMVLS